MCRAVRGQHRVLKGVGGVVGIAAGEMGQPVQLAVVPVEELLEGVAVAADVRDQQLGVGAHPFGLTASSPENPHSRTLIGTAAGARHQFLRHRTPARVFYDAAFRVISAMSERLSPLTCPSVDTHTSTFDVGVASCTSMVLEPGFSGVG